jgi:hypothetical protein
MHDESDDQIRAALAPLRQYDPDPVEVGELRAGAGALRRRRGRRLIGGVAVAALATATVVAAPSVEQDSGSGAVASARSMLLANAAVAAEQHRPSSDARFRYVLEDDKYVYPPSGGQGGGVVEQMVESWVDASLDGQIKYGRGFAAAGDPREARAFPADTERFALLAEGPEPDPAALPTDAADLRQKLVELYRSVNWAPGLPTKAQTRYDISRQILLLLTYPNLEPDLRAALFRALALDPTITTRQQATDDSRLPNTTTVIVIPTRTDGTGHSSGAIRAYFEPHTSELVWWSEIGTGHGSPDQYHSILRSGEVGHVGERPGDGTQANTD